MLCCSSLPTINGLLRVPHTSTEHRMKTAIPTHLFWVPVLQVIHHKVPACQQHDYLHTCKPHAARAQHSTAWRSTAGGFSADSHCCGCYTELAIAATDSASLNMTSNCNWVVAAIRQTTVSLGCALRAGTSVRVMSYSMSYSLCWPACVHLLT
jgi:hypothetical protein